MNNELLPGLFDAELGITQPEQVLFDYEQVPVDRRGFVLQKTAETQWLLKRTAEDIVTIGDNLLAVKEKLPHGLFGKWITSEFQMSHDRANVFMNISKRLGTKLRGPRNFDLGIEVLKELASPFVPDSYADQVISGQITPTLEDIKQAKIEARLAKEAAKRAEANALAAQQQLFNVKDASQSEIDALSRQMEALKQEMETLSTPEVEIREVTKEVLPLSVKNNLETLQQQIDKLSADLETEKKAIPPAVQKKLDNLQKQADKLKQQEEANTYQQQRIDKLTEELNAAIRDGVASENDERIRQEWRLNLSEGRSCLARILGNWPTPLDKQSFEADDWALLDHFKQTLHRVLEECNNLHYNGDEMIIDDRMAVEAPLAYIESGNHAHR